MQFRSFLGIVMILITLVNINEVKCKWVQNPKTSLGPAVLEEDFEYLGDEQGSGSGNGDDDDGSGDDVDNNGQKENKFVESTIGSGIILEHVDFVLLRLKHILMTTSSNITELTNLQQKEFTLNPVYQSGWNSAALVFSTISKRTKIYGAPKANDTDSILARSVPEAYHIAIIAYTLDSPALFKAFNKDTRDICSGKDVAAYQWKSYFKLLHLAVESLGSGTTKWMDNRRFLYRGATQSYKLEEGQVLAFQHFISTSAQLPVAENFAQGNTLFEFQGFYNGTAMAIWDHSVYASEQEVLFSPVQVFRVDSVHVGKYHKRYVLVKQQLTDDDPPCKETTELKDIREEDTNTGVESSTIFSQDEFTTESGSTWTQRNLGVNYLLVSALLLRVVVFHIQSGNELLL